MHVTLVPFIDAAGELKTKPTQHSVNELRRIGIHPDVVVCRSREELSEDIRDKIALFADVDTRAVIASPDVPDVYLVPQALQREGLDELVCERLGLETAAAELGEWLELEERIGAHGDVTIALVGKYVKLHDAYLSVHEALKHAGVHHGVRVHVRWVDAENMSYEEAVDTLDEVDGVLVPGGFGSRGWEGKILACRVARERGIPYLGICLGMHVAVSEFARHVVGLDGANSTEMDPETPHPVIDLLPEQKEVEDLGGTMRLGAQAVEVADGTRARDAVRRARRPRAAPPPLRGEQPPPAAPRRGRARRLRDVPGGRLVEIVELPDHPWFVASQFHPEFKSRPTRPAPLFRDFVGAALDALARARSGPRACRPRRGLRKDAARADPAVSSEFRAPRSSSSPSSPRSRARPARSAPSPTASRPSSRARPRGGRGRLRAANRIDDRATSTAVPRATAPRTPLFFCAHLDTVPPEGSIEPVVDEDGFVRNPAGTILGADNKAAVVAMVEACAASSRSGGRTRASSSSSRRRKRSA